jgi:tetratricopeptide (TPR) repeat protein
MLKALSSIAAGALVALALWPAVAARKTPAATVTPVPVVADYATRDQLIAFYERQMREYPQDQIQMRLLAQQYMQRFREQYDFNDVNRAERLAEHSIRLQPQGNTSAQMTLASALLSYHDFRHALQHDREAQRGEPSNDLAVAQIASLQMELGHYDAARATLASLRPGPAENPGVDAVRARFDEVTGHLADARAFIDSASRSADSDIGDPAYDRAWYHFRAGQLAFEAGDHDAALAQYTIALADFPHNAVTLMWQARLFLAEKRWDDALASATQSADLYPLPQALGYKADAERALGDASGAAQTDALIGAEERIFDVAGVNDRLLANYYAERGIHLDVALRAALRDYLNRGDEIYADDTLARVYAAMGRWPLAHHYAERALRYGTQDPEIQEHSGVIAERVILTKRKADDR